MPATGLEHAGQFIIEELDLITSSGLRIDLRTSVMGITIFEDIFNMTITGTIAIQDSVNLASAGPLIGQEYLHLKIKTPFIKEHEDNIIDFSKNAFLVHSISRRQRFTEGVQGVVMSFVSQELVKNQRLKVTHSLTDTWSNIVKKMLRSPLWLNSKKKLEIEPTIGIKKIVAPNIRPLDVVVMAMKQSISEYKGEPTYLFYETLKGFNFRTLTSLYNRGPLMEYGVFQPGTNISEGVVDVFLDLRTILNYEIALNNDSITNYRTGMYGSQLVTHDIISKNYTMSQYNYHDNWPNEEHIVGGVTKGDPEFPIVSGLVVNEYGQRVSDFPARTFLLPTSLTGGVDSQHTTKNNTHPYAANDPHKWLQRRNSQMIQLENALQVNVEVHGQTLLNVGDKVLLHLPYSASLKSKEDGDFDRFYRGPFLVKKIRHEFVNTENPKHTMHMQLVKDSLEQKLADTGPIEPSAPAAKLIEKITY
tara:strand:+ start:111 stop:1535 length:1425 start_codon:yes stop_codon:yes gene_type:complete